VPLLTIAGGPQSTCWTRRPSEKGALGGANDARGGLCFPEADFLPVADGAVHRPSRRRSGILYPPPPGTIPQRKRLRSTPGVEYGWHTVPDSALPQRASRDDPRRYEPTARPSAGWPTPQLRSCRHPLRPPRGNQARGQEPHFRGRRFRPPNRVYGGLIALCVPGRPQEPRFHGRQPGSSDRQRSPRGQLAV
jgi:hypothetical protein